MRKSIFGLVLAVAVIGLGIAWTVAAAKPAPPQGALIVVFYPDKPGVAKVHLLSDAKQIAALAAHFPGYEMRPSSNIAGAWMSGYNVYFDFAEGVSVRLSVSHPNLQPAHWSAGRGDLDVEGDFHKFVAGLSAIADEPSSAFVGKWTLDGKAPSGEKVVLEFKADGTFEETETTSGRTSKFSGTWEKQSDSKATLTRSDVTVKADVTLTDKQTLELLPEGGKPLVYKRMP